MATRRSTSLTSSSRATRDTACSRRAGPRSASRSARTADSPRAAELGALRALGRAGAEGAAGVPGETIGRGGGVVTPMGVHALAIAIAEGTIVALGAEALVPRGDRVIDAAGKIVLPGASDCH